MELYHKIYIKSEVDLPKEVGEYITNIGFTHWERKIGWYFIDEDYGDNHRVTIEHGVDWYLQPDEITDADIEAWVNNQRLVGITDPGWVSFDDVATAFKMGLRSGTKAVLNGEIKHIEK